MVGDRTVRLAASVENNHIIGMDLRRELGRQTRFANAVLTGDEDES